MSSLTRPLTDKELAAAGIEPAPLAHETFTQVFAVRDGGSSTSSTRTPTTSRSLKPPTPGRRAPGSRSCWPARSRSSSVRLSGFRRWCRDHLRRHPRPRRRTVTAVRARAAVRRWASRSTRSVAAPRWSSPTRLGAAAGPAASATAARISLPERRLCDERSRPLHCMRRPPWQPLLQPRPALRCATSSGDRRRPSGDVRPSRRAHR